MAQAETASHAPAEGGSSTAPGRSRMHSVVVVVLVLLGLTSSIGRDRLVQVSTGACGSPQVRFEGRAWRPVPSGPTPDAHLGALGFVTSEQRDIIAVPTGHGPAVRFEPLPPLC